MFPDNPHAGLQDSKDSVSLLPSGFSQQPPAPAPAQAQATARPSSHHAYPKPRPNRPRKTSVTENARKGKHERQRSKDHKRLSGERKALSVEPGGLVQGRRWEDLLDAAASATEEDSRDLTPVSLLLIRKEAGNLMLTWRGGDTAVATRLCSPLPSTRPKSSKSLPVLHHVASAKYHFASLTRAAHVEFCARATTARHVSDGGSAGRRSAPGRIPLFVSARPQLVGRLQHVEPVPELRATRRPPSAAVVLGLQFPHRRLGPVVVAQGHALVGQHDVLAAARAPALVERAALRRADARRHRAPADARVAGRALLRGVSAADAVEFESCLHRVHLWHLPRLRRRACQHGPGPRRGVSAVQYDDGAVQAVHAGPAMTFLSLLALS